MALLDISDLHLSMRSFEGETPILKGIDLTVERGQIWGVVGETGSGKSLTGLTISRLLPTTTARYTGGQVRFDGKDVLRASDREMRALRGGRIGMIFQDPTTNLNPSFRIGTQMVDAALHAARDKPEILGLTGRESRRARRRAAWDASVALLESFGLHDAADRMTRFPHEFSGGMRQRVLIAMAMIGQPDLLIADEPTTALDVSVQSQILRLIHRLVEERNIGVMFITHNLGVVAQLCSHVAVMYRGRIVERGPVTSVLKAPEHIYTRALMDAIPTARAQMDTLRGIDGPLRDRIEAEIAATAKEAAA
ncbi:ABC transporter ATP-binding protein [Alloyangia pacifica]|uniref:ABC transporter ATP-binding protein n=1 Tax=Alloyangia pacifica TaxID=311180 RepID=UPI001CFC71F6|nr:ABC transporter ATP-binding protein [Alloyangia pacifica]